MVEETTSKRWQLDEGVVIEPDRDVLVDGWLHKVMLAFHQPASWPSWLVALVMLLGVLFVGAVWGLAAGSSVAALALVSVMLLFFLADTLWLISLPRREISFGPWQAQIFVFAVPRLLAALFIGLFAGWGGWQVCVALTAVLQFIGSLLLAYGTAVEPFKLSLTHLEIATDRLAPEFEPIRLLHITDLHVEYLTKREAQVLAFVEQSKPDVIVVSGDYVNLSYNRDPQTLAQIQGLLRQIQAPYGVFATLGSPPVDLRETVVPLFADLPVVLMRGEWQKVGVGNGRFLTIIGLDCTHDLPTDRARLAKLVAAAPNGSPQLLLYHSPEIMPEAAEYGLDLYLCGHTHGGQVRLPLIGPLLTSSQLGRRFVMGLYKIERTHLYVSRGIGLEGLSAPRVRFLCPPEMTLVTISPANSEQ